MMRTMLEALISEKGGRKSLRADLKESSIPDFESFHKSSFFFGHLLNFSGKCCTAGRDGGGEGWGRDGGIGGWGGGEG